MLKKPGTNTARHNNHPARSIIVGIATPGLGNAARELWSSAA